MWRISVWLVNTLERVRCAVIGHDVFDDPRYTRAWCTRCPKKFR